MGPLHFFTTHRIASTGAEKYVGTRASQTLTWNCILNECTTEN